MLVKYHRVRARTWTKGREGTGTRAASFTRCPELVKSDTSNLRDLLEKLL